MSKVTNHKTFKSLVLNLKRRAKWMQMNADERLKTAATTGLHSVAMGTPADTGLARSSWKVGINRIPDITPRKRPFFPGKNLGMDEGSNAMGSIRAGYRRLKRVKAHHTVYILNTQPYLNSLNDSPGKSPQNRHFIEKALDKVRRVHYSRSLLGKPVKANSFRVRSSG